MRYELELASERCRDQFDAVTRDRMLSAVEPRLTVARRVARPLGRVLLNAGVWLLRYGRTDDLAAMGRHQPSAGSLRLN
jgi:hypothetical protein